MAIEKAVVLKVYDDSFPTVLVRAGRSVSCKSCSSRESCKGEKDTKNIEISLPNTVGARVGDMVLLKIDTFPFLKLTFLVYVFPILSMVLGLCLGHAFILFFNYSTKSQFPIIFASLSLLLSFVGIRIIGGKLSKKDEYQPKIVRIVDRFNCN